jgi:hypothetical protein
MYEQVEKSKENTSRAVAQKIGGVNPISRFIDNRSKASKSNAGQINTIQLKIEGINNSLELFQGLNPKLGSLNTNEAEYVEHYLRNGDTTINAIIDTINQWRDAKKVREVAKSNVQEYGGISAHRQSKSTNDAGNSKDAASNCSLCSVSSLFGETPEKMANFLKQEIKNYKRDQIKSDDDLNFETTIIDREIDKIDQVMLLTKFAQITRPDKIVTLANQTELQFLGMVDLLQKLKQNPITKIGINVQEAESLLKAQQEGTRFLIYASHGAMAHWTAGQVQGKMPIYFDYQTDIKDEEIRSKTAKENDVQPEKLSGVTENVKILGAFGKLLPDDGKVDVIYLQ